MTTGDIHRLEALAETTLLAIQQLAFQQREPQTQLTNSVEDLVRMVGDLAQGADADRQAIREMQSEIRGLQAENRRILDVLLNQQGEQEQE
jgi:hypothetical protein